jgi:multidrug resistance efflux pump
MSNRHSDLAKAKAGLAQAEANAIAAKANLEKSRANTQLAEKKCRTLFKPDGWCDFQAGTRSNVCDT